MKSNRVTVIPPLLEPDEQRTLFEKPLTQKTPKHGKKIIKITTASTMSKKK